MRLPGAGHAVAEARFGAASSDQPLLARGETGRRRCIERGRTWASGAPPLRPVACRDSCSAPGWRLKPAKAHSEVTSRVRYCGLGGSSAASRGRGRERPGGTRRLGRPRRGNGRGHEQHPTGAHGPTVTYWWQTFFACASELAGDPVAPGRNRR